MATHVAPGRWTICAVAALCVVALGMAPAFARQSDPNEPLVDMAGEVHELPAIDGTGDQVYLDFNAPLDRIVASLLRTSSYRWSYGAFDGLIEKHTRARLRAAIAEQLRKMPDGALRRAHRDAASDPMSPLFDLRLPGDTWAEK
ncbi:MAG: hypothetical protein J0H65_03660 [Rhizobiales bacterium]|nr:hypothetical protein [Hyphomicrobiales bacterium]